MGSRRTGRKPSIYIDEHFHPAVKEVFGEAGFRTVAVARDSRYAGKDERDYIELMYGRNEILVTGDAEFVQWVLDNRPKHAGIVFVPQTIASDEKLMLASMAAAVILATVRDARFQMRGTVLYAAHDGFRAIQRNGDDSLVFSWEWYRQLSDDG
jgi:hypothetical protein